MPEVLYRSIKLAKLLEILMSNTCLIKATGLSLTERDDLIKTPQNALLEIDAAKLKSKGLQFVKYDEDYAESIGANDAVNSEKEWRIIGVRSIPNFTRFIISVTIQSSDQFWDKTQEEELRALCEDRNIPLIEK